MRLPLIRIPALGAALLLCGGCQGVDDKGLALEATGTVAGVAFLDRDDNGRLDPTDGPVPSIGVGLLLRGTRDTTARASTDPDGIYGLPVVPVGSYRLLVDGASVPDSLRLLRVDSADVTVAATDTVIVLIALGYPTLTTAEARSTPVGRRVALRGVALNDWAAFGDSTVHVADASGALRAVRVAPADLAAGDSVRLVGTLGTRDGRPVLSDVTPYVVGAAEPPPPVQLTTAAAAGAESGARDAALVRIVAASVLDARTTPVGDAVLTVDDGSGALEVLLDRHAGFTTAPLPGARIEAAGLLVPGTAGRWQLKPRSGADLDVEYPTVAVAEARALPAGKRVAVRGVALSGWAAFGDSTLHLADSTGALRAIRVAQANVFAGDTVRLLGVVGIRDGQPVLADAVASVLALGPSPAPRQVTTARAAAADGGGLDAALVRIAGATIADTATTAAGDRRLTVDDGSGPLQVLLDRHAGFAAGAYVPGMVLETTGVLVARPEGVGWMLKPRAGSDTRVQ